MGVADLDAGLRRRRRGIRSPSLLPCCRCLEPVSQIELRRKRLWLFRRIRHVRGIVRPGRDNC